MIAASTLKRLFRGGSWNLCKWCRDCHVPGLHRRPASDGDEYAAAMAKELVKPGQDHLQITRPFAAWSAGRQPRPSLWWAEPPSLPARPLVAAVPITLANTSSELLHLDWTVSCRLRSLAGRKDLIILSPVKRICRGSDAGQDRQGDESGEDGLHGRPPCLCSSMAEKWWACRQFAVTHITSARSEASLSQTGADESSVPEALQDWTVILGLAAAHLRRVG